MLLFSKLLLFSAILIVAISTVEAQQNISAATLSGTIEDANGANIQGTNITLKNLETGQTQNAVTDKTGRFRFAYVTVGNYELTVQQKGFTPLTQKITATIGQTLDINLQMKIAEVSEQVNVSANTPIIETSRTQIAATILPSDISDLPLNGRNYLDLALLLPSV